MEFLSKRLCVNASSASCTTPTPSSPPAPRPPPPLPACAQLPRDWSYRIWSKVQSGCDSRVSHQTLTNTSRASESETGIVPPHPRNLREIFALLLQMVPNAQSPTCRGCKRACLEHNCGAMTHFQPGPRLQNACKTPGWGLCCLRHK